MATPTLTDVLNGFFQYLSARPDGGSRAGLIAAGVAQGWDRTAVEQWIDRLLQGLVDQLVLSTPDYDGAFVPLFADKGLAVVAPVVRSAYSRLTSEGSFKEMLLQQRIAQANSAIVTLTTRHANATQGLADAEAALAPGQVTNDFLAAAATGVDQIQGTLDAVVLMKARLEEELSGN